MEERIREIRKGLLRWYDFKPDSKILYIGSKQDALAELLTEIGEDTDITCMSWQETIQLDWLEKNRGTFDYLISITD